MTTCAGTNAPMREAAPRRSIPADRDLAAQLRCIDALIRDEDSIAESFVRPLYETQEMQEQLSRSATLVGDAKSMVQSRLRRACQQGPLRTVRVAPEPQLLEVLDADFPNFSAVTSIVKGHLALCRCASEHVLRLTPMLLWGPPGVGKSLYLKRLGQLLGLPVTELQVATLSATFSLGGLDSSYASSKPGLVWNALEGDCMSPLIVLVEIEKLPPAHTGALGCLYSLLERHSARRFRDEAVPLPIDASYICWMSTCNDLDAIEPALRSRFHLIIDSAVKY